MLWGWKVWEHFGFPSAFCHKIEKLLCYKAGDLLLLKAVSGLRVTVGMVVKLFIMTEIIIFIQETEAQVPFRKST